MRIGHHPSPNSHLFSCHTSLSMFPSMFINLSVSKERQRHQSRIHLSIWFPLFLSCPILCFLEKCTVSFTRAYEDPLFHIQLTSIVESIGTFVFLEHGRCGALEIVYNHIFCSPQMNSSFIPVSKELGDTVQAEDQGRVGGGKTEIKIHCMWEEKKNLLSKSKICVTD